jgi:DNA-binding CsgD family transcriptional regulator
MPGIPVHFSHFGWSAALAVDQEDEPPATASALENVLDEALARLGRSVGFDAARALAYDPGVLIPVSFAGSAPLLDWKHTVAACRNEQAEDDVHKFADLAVSRQHVAVMTAESTEARQSPRWQNLILPDGFRHELRAVAVDDHGHCWGSVTAFRDGRRPFTDRAITAAGRDLSQIAARLSRAAIGGAATPRPDQAASLWLSDTGELRSATQMGRKWLDRLRTSETPGRAEALLTGLAFSVTASIARSGPGSMPHPVSVRARGGRGQWIVLHGEPVIGPDGQSQGIGVVIGPAEAGTVLPVLAAAYGLTGREQQVVSCVFSGLSTRQISNRLHISTYTVQDHLKAIFTKVGVNSRSELAHRLALQFT